MFNRGDSSSNTAIGNSSLYFNINASFNTACGFQALGGASRVSNPFSDEPNPNQDADSGFRNTATGAQALFSNLGGNENTADGDGALLFNLNGHDNTATGKSALSGNANGSFNTANGAFALFGGDGSLNTATGFDAMLDNTSGNRNTGDGVFALSANSTGSDNTAIGAEALGSNSTGSFNTAIGSGALLSNTSGNSNIALGASAGTRLTTGSGNIDIGNPGDRLDSYTIRIGRSDIKAGYKGNTSNAYIGGIRGVTIANGVGVIIDTQGHLGTWVSSARFKEAIEPMDNASEAILSLKPVTFRYKHELDPDGIPQFGLVAEQVEKVNHDLVARDDQGRPDTVRYEAVNAMLLNEFLKEHRRVEALEATVAKLQSVVQKVSNQIELTKPGPQVVINQ